MTYDRIWHLCSAFAFAAVELECERIKEPRGRMFSRGAADELRTYLQQAAPLHDFWPYCCEPLVEGVRLVRKRPNLPIERAHLFLLVQMRLLERFASGGTLSDRRLTKLVELMTGAHPILASDVGSEQWRRRLA